MVRVEKAWFISSIENNTPPIGEPKATATPAALAAVRTSRILTAKVSHVRHLRTQLTLAITEPREEAADDVANRTRDVHRGTLLAN